MRRRQLPGTYERVDTSETDGFTDEQFIESQIKPKTPWSTILFILLFFIGGTSCLSIGLLLHFGFFEEKYNDRAWPAIIIGCMMFIPGAFYIKSAICIALKVPGYSLEDIPRFNDN